MEKVVEKPIAEPRSFDEVIEASTPVHASGRTAMMPYQSEGNAVTRLFNKEDRRHWEIQRTVDHVVVEILQAQHGMGLIADDVVATQLEHQVQTENLLHAYRGSRLAMAAAPEIVADARELLAQGVQDVSRAGFRHISDKVGRRR